MRRVSLALMLIFAAPIALAQEPALVAHSLTATGDVDADGALRLMVRENDPSVDAAFQLTAGNLRVEVARADPVVDGRVTTYSHNPSVEPTEYDDAQVRGTDLRDGQRWILLPESGTARIEAACLKVEGHASASVQRNPRVGFEGGSIGADTSRTSLVHPPCSSDAVLEVEGDFRLVLWEWDIQVQTVQTRDAYWSGQRESTSVPGGAAHEHREVHLHATDAYLRVGLAEADLIYMADASTHVDGHILLDRATGRVATANGDIQADGNTVQITGDVDVDVTRNEDLLGLRISGRVDGVRLNGQAVAVEPGIRGGVAAWSLATLALVGVAWTGHARQAPIRAYWRQKAPRFAASTRRQRRGAGYTYMARDANDGNHFHKAEKLARRARSLHPGLEAAKRAHYVALSGLDRHGEAIEVMKTGFQDLDTPRQRAETAMMIAASCLQLGKHGEARGWMEGAVKVDGLAVAVASRDQAFDAVRREPWFQVIQEGNRLLRALGVA